MLNLIYTEFELENSLKYALSERVSFFLQWQSNTHHEYNEPYLFHAMLQLGRIILPLLLRLIINLSFFYLCVCVCVLSAKTPLPYVCPFAWSQVSLIDFIYLVLSLSLSLSSLCFGHLQCCQVLVDSIYMSFIRPFISL